MVKTLELAISKASNLPAEAQQQLGRELLERIDTLEFDIEDTIRQAREEHAKNV